MGIQRKEQFIRVEKYSGNISHWHFSLWFCFLCVFLRTDRHNTILPPTPSALQQVILVSEGMFIATYLKRVLVDLQVKLSLIQKGSRHHLSKCCPRKLMCARIFKKYVHQGY